MATRSPRMIVAVLASTGLAASIGQSLFLPVLPDLPDLLGVTPDAASLLITVTFVAGAVAVPSVTRLADMYGKRRMVIVTLLALAVGGVIGAVGDSFALVMASRALQGVGLALLPLGASILRDEIPRARLGTAVAFMSATLGIGSAVGLPLSGFLYMYFGWHALFWVTTLLSVALLAAVVVIVPESPIRTGGRFDLVGAVLLSVALVPLLLGITRGGSWGWTSLPTVACFATTVVVLALWVPWEFRNAQPVVDLRVSMTRPVLLTNIMSVLVGFAFYMNLLTATSQLQLPVATGYGFGESVLYAGLFMLPAAAMMIVVSPMSAVITRRRGARWTLIIGSAILSAGYVLRMVLVTSAWQLLIGTVVVSIGIAITYSALPVMIMRSVPVTETAAANGLNTVVRFVGSATATAVTAAILTSLTLDFDGATIPSPQAFWLTHLFAALAAAIATLIAAALPRQVGASTEEARSPVLADEHLVHGTVVDPDGAPAPHARVWVQTQSDPRVDWATCDEHGEFTVAVPSDRSYAIIARRAERGQYVRVDSPVAPNPAADPVVVVLNDRAGRLNA